MTKPNVKLVNQAGKVGKTQSAFTALADYEVRPVLLSEVIRCEMMSLRSGNAHTKTRAEVRGGGRKPWKQKGTGRARHGSTRSPIWIGGGVTFGPRNTRNWNRKINRSARVSALKSIIKDRLNDENVYLLDGKFDFSKTKTTADFFSNLDFEARKAMLVYTNADKTAIQGFLNTDVKMINAANLKIHKLANAVNFIMTPSAMDLIEARFEPKTETKETVTTN